MEVQQAKTMELEQASLRRRIPELDGLRGIAILLIIACHYIIAGPAHVGHGSIASYLLTLNRLTWSGVDLFFVLSGFLIGGILLDEQRSANYFKAFYMRRFCRILPIYIVTCLLFWLGTWLLTDSHNRALLALFENHMPWYTYATFTQNFWRAQHNVNGHGWLGITWSLAVEEQFYLTLPFLIRYLKRAYLPYVLGATILAVPLFRTLLYFIHPHASVAAFVLMPCRADSLLLGVMAALYVRTRTGWTFLVTHKRLLYVSLGVLSLGMAVFTRKYWTGGALPMLTFGYTWIALFYLCLLLIAITQPRSIVSRVTRNRLLMEVGIIAYGTYLFHRPVQSLAFSFILGHEPQFIGLPSIAVSLLSLILTLAIAKASWIYFEKLFVRYSHKYNYSNGSAITDGPGLAPKMLERNDPVLEGANASI